MYSSASCAASSRLDLSSVTVKMISSGTLSGHTASNAVDDDSDTFWADRCDGCLVYIGAEFEKDVAVRCLRYITTFNYYTANNWVTEANLESRQLVSDEWIPVLTRTGLTQGENFLTTYPTIAPNTRAKAWRIFTTGSKTTASYFRVYSLELYSSANCDSNNKLELSTVTLISSHPIDDVDNRQRAIDRNPASFWSHGCIHDCALYIGVEFERDVIVRCVRYVSNVKWATEATLQARQSDSPIWVTVSNKSGLTEGDTTFQNYDTPVPSALPCGSPSGQPSSNPSSSLSVSLSVTCEDNSIVKFKVPKNNGEKKNTKCNKIKEKDCDTTFKFKKKVDGVKEGKPKDFCKETCNPKECCKDGTDIDYKIKTKEGTNVSGKFSCEKIKRKGYCKGKLRTGEKLKDVCKASCDRACE